MHLDISSLKENKGKSIQFRFEEIFTPLEFAGEMITFSKPVIAEGSATNVESGILVKGTVEAEATLRCDRCLQPADFGLHAEFTEEFLEEKGPGRHAEETEVDYNTYKGNTIDIRDVVEENILLNVPMKTLCSAECKGICSICGADLNFLECGCAREDVDPRMQKLRDWFQE